MATKIDPITDPRITLEVLTPDDIERVHAATLEVIERCDCESGCPSCVQSPKCGNWNTSLDKAGAVRLLRTALAP